MSVRLLLGRSAVVTIALLLAGDAAVAARLDYRGGAFTRREIDAVFAPALRAPRDSAALVAGLGRLVTELENRGYLDARARGEWTGEGSDPVLALETREGPRYRLASLAIDAGGGPDSAAVAAALGLAPGSWASPGATRLAVERAARSFADRGRPYASLGVTSFDWDASGARVRVSATLGPTVTVSDVRLEGLQSTRQAVARRAMGQLAGATYDRREAEAARDRLLQLGLFRRVTYQGLEGEPDWSRARLVYQVEEPRYNRFEGAAGLQGDSRVVGLARLDLDNLSGTGRAVGLRWEARGRGIQDFGARYAEPLVLGAPLKIEGMVEQHLEDTLYTRTRWGGRLQFTLSGQEKLEAGYEQERVVQPHGELEQADLQTTVFALERDARDQRTAPRRGTRARLSAAQTFKDERLRPELTIDGAQRRKSRAGAIDARFEWHRPLGRGASRSGLAFDLSGAGRFSSQRVLPLFERYGVGGAASLRGHDEQAFRVDRYALSRLEYRFFLGGDQHVALFWDHAWMAAREPVPLGGDRLEIRNRDGIGFGLRLATPGGLVGVDYGVEPGRPPLEGKIHLQLVSTF